MGGGSYLYQNALGHDWVLDEIDAPITGETHVQGQFHCARCDEKKTDEYCAADFFTDMPARDTWSHTAIDWAYAAGITTGTSATAFSPKNTCTRAQVVTFLWRASGSPEPEVAEETEPQDDPAQTPDAQFAVEHRQDGIDEPDDTQVGFTDVDEHAYYYQAVQWAVASGVTKGTSETTFSPNAPCTRAQVVTFLWRTAGEQGTVEAENADAQTDASEIMPFTDVREGAYYETAVQWAIENGITQGVSDSLFAPETICTREQIVTFLFRFCVGQAQEISN